MISVGAKKTLTRAAFMLCTCPCRLSPNRPHRPAATCAMPSHLLQMDASDYRNSAALPAGAVLVVGSAQCGGQIAEDLAQASRKVFLATGRVGRMPRRYRGCDIVYWLRRSGLFDVPRKDFLDPSGRILGRPLLGVGHRSACNRSAHWAWFSSAV